MNKLGWQTFVSMFALTLATLACGGLDVGALINPLPNDDFSNTNSGWGVGTDSFSSVEYAGGGLQMIVYDPFSITWSIPGLESLENVHIEASVKNQSSDTKAFFGIICNGQGSTESFYYVGVSSDGYYAFVKSAVAKDDEYLKKDFSDVISTGFSGQTVRLGLDCGSGTLTLYVNGQRIDSVSDSTYPSGTVGLFAATDEKESGVNVIFDDFVVTKLGK